MNPAKISRNLFIALVVLATLALNGCRSGQYCKSWNSPSASNWDTPTKTLSTGELRQSNMEIAQVPDTNKYHK